MKKELMCRKDCNKGITLVALVITIIILLILAGITIAQLTGNGLFVRTEQAKEKYSIAEAKEKLNLLITNLKLEIYSKEKRNPDLVDFKNVINSEQYLELEEENYDSNNELANVKVSYKDCVFLIDNNLSIIDNYYNEENNENEENDELDKHVLLGYSSKESNVEEIVQALKLLDKTSNGNDAQLSNVFYNDNKRGIIFDGSSSYATLNSKPNISFPVTITTAVKWEEKEGTNILYIDKNSGLAIGKNDDGFLVSAGSYKSYFYSVPENFFENEINYITVVYNDASNNELYINGQKIAKTTKYDAWNNTQETSTIYLGRRNKGDYFKGILYDFKIYNKLFSEQEVMQRYQKEKNDFENNTNNTNEQAEYLVLDYVCDANENESKTTLNAIKNKTNSDYDIKLSDVEYDTNKKGLVFNGTSSYGTLDKNKLNINFPVTMTTAVKWEEKEGTNILFIDINSGLGIGKNDEGFLVSSGSYKSYYYNIPENFFENEINYITVVYNNDPTDNELYINGQKMVKATKTESWSYEESSTIYLGRRNRGDYFKGILYDFKIYDKLFTEDEVLSKYQKDKKYYTENN